MSGRSFARTVGAVLAFAGLGLGGCGTKLPRYYVAAQQHESVPDKVDGQWFTREIWLQNRLEGIELVYCPILPEPQNNEVAVCRTAIVWEANHSRLTDAPSDADKGRAAPAPAPAPAPASAESPSAAPPAEAAPAPPAAPTR